MKRTLAVLIPMVALVLLLLGGWVRADAVGNNGLCGGGTESKDSRESDLASARVAPPRRNATRRVGVGLLSAAFMTSGWLFFRRQGPRA
ncbi:MAG: hypothetical protein WBV96_22250 [Polyangia bacterium]|jgi:hypothetical protein